MLAMRFKPRLAAAARLALLVAIAGCAASCSSKEVQSPGMASVQLSPAAAGSCKIDAVKMCEVTEGYAATAPSSPPAAGSTQSSYTSTVTSDSVEFQIPAGQNIKLTCYSDPRHGSIYRADATVESSLTGNSVEYLKKRGFCVKK